MQVWCAAAVLSLIGCATDRSSSAPPSGGATSADALSSHLDELAARERALPARPVPEVEVPLPRALKPEAGARVEVGPRDRIATLELADALADVIRVPMPLEIIEPVAEARDAALGHYVRGMDLSHLGEADAAISALEDARALDPMAPSILRALAHRYGARGDTGLAIARFEDLLRVVPDDREALLTVAMAAHLRREQQRSVELLARREQAPPDPDEDPGADRVAMHVLHQAFAELGYDRASIDAGVLVASGDDARGLPTRFSARLAAIFRARAEVWRAVGDAWLRLNRPADAIAAYDAAAEAPVADPASLLWRAVYARMRLGHRHDAERLLLDGLEDSAPECPDYLVSIATWLGNQPTADRTLSEAVSGLARAHPDSASLARASAVLLPSGEGRDVLASFVRRRPRDLPGVRGMLRWLAARDSEQAIDLVATLCAAQPDLADAYTDELLLAIPRASLVSRMAARDANHAALATRVDLRSGSIGAAWQTVSAGRERTPDDPGLARLAVQVAARLDETELVLDAIASSPSGDSARPWTLVVRARALGVVEAIAEAHVVLDEALEADTAGTYASAILLTRARLLIVEAGELPDVAERDARLGAAISTVESVLDIDPKNEEAYELLLGLYDRGSAVADSARRAAIAARARQDAAGTNIVLRLDVERDLLRGLDEQALATARRWAERSPMDDTAYSALALASDRLGRAQDLDRWLEAALARHPAAPIVLEARVGVLLRSERSEEARDLLEQRVAADEDDISAWRLLERVYRAREELDRAAELAEHRLALRPEGGRRWLEEGMALAGAHRGAEALSRVALIVDAADTMASRHLIGAAGLLDAVPPGRERDDVAIRLAEAAAASGGLPLVVSAPGLEALARSENDGPRLAALVAATVTTARESAETGPDAIGPWRRLAQRLVDSDFAALAASVLRARLWAEPTLGDDARRMFAALTIIADAVCVDGATATLDFLHELDRSGLTPILAGLPDGTLVDALFEASQIYSLIGAAEGSEVILREVLRLSPDHAMALNNLGYRRLEIGVLDERTVAMIEHAAALQPDDENVLDTLAWLRYHQGQLDDAGALSLLEAIASGEAPSAEVLDHYGDTLWRLGRSAEAEAAWRQGRALLRDDRRRTLVIRNLGLLQVQSWGLLVVDPEEAYDQAFGGALDRIEAKLRAVREGDEPPIALQLGERP